MNATSDKRRQALSAARPAGARRSRCTARSAVTLVELLITIAIMSLLSAIIWGATNSAMESSREARTKSVIAKLHGLLMERWESFETRRVDLQFSNGTPYANGVKPGQSLAFARLEALRMAMKLEMPDRWSDILGSLNGTTNVSIDGALVADQLPNSSFVTPTRKLVATYQNRNNQATNASIEYPALTAVYLRHYNSLVTNDVGKILDNQGAECLYMIIMESAGDGEARTLFQEKDIGDTDGDGALEFLDGWGRPIDFYRWPVGFVLRSNLMTGDPQNDHDPFDRFRVHPLTPVPLVDELKNTYAKTETNPDKPNNTKVLIGEGFRLVPLIVSAGPDGDWDLASEGASLTTLDPYDKPLNNSGQAYYIAYPRDSENPPDGDNSVDNITNHDVGS